MKKFLLLVALFCCVGLGVSAQSNAQKALSEPESHEGLLPVLSYLGGKLVGELKTRFNLQKETDTVSKIKTKVTLKIGSFEVETHQMREVSEI